MQRIPRFLRNAIFCQLALTLFSSFVMAAPVPLRLDFYDASNNHLMYMIFKYDGAGRTTGRTIYMPDETFMRDIVVNYDALGRRLNEVSYDFNGDTMYVTSYQQAGDKTSFNVTDRFWLDMAGDRITYANSDPLNFSLRYAQSNEQAAALSYTKDPATGQLVRVDVVGQGGNDSYYGRFSYGDAILTVSQHPVLNGEKLPQASIHFRGSRIDVNFNLHCASNIRCELLTLSGSRVAVLFNGRIQNGSFTRQFTPDKDAGRLANGVYLFKISVNGAGVAHSRYLHQSSRAGGVQ